MNTEEKVLQIPVESIVPNRFQPRLTFDENALQELAQSIKEHGIIQPLVLRKNGDKYEIIAGERRYKASQMAGLKTVPAIISDIDDKKSAEVALVENIQRKNLTSIEEAKSYKNILDQGYLTQEQLAEKLGISQATVANKLRLLNLADEVQDALLQEKISERHARSLLAIKDKNEQVKWLNRILNERLTVRQLDIEIKKELKNIDDEEEDIPIVDLNPNIDEIKQSAIDINPVQGLHDVEKMLKPTQENSFNLSNPIDTIETLDFDDDYDKSKNEILEPVEDNKIPNKFFNFLEDEGANMNENEAIDELYLNDNKQSNIEIPINSEQIENNNVISETIPSNDINLINDDNSININNVTNETILNSINNSSQDLIDNSIINSNIINNKENNINSMSEEANVNVSKAGKFFNFDFSNENANKDLNIQNNNTDNQNYNDNNIITLADNNIDLNSKIDSNDEATDNNFIFDMNDSNNIENINTDDDINNANNYIFDGPLSNSSTNNNVIELEQNSKDNDLFDPMNMVDTLDDNYEEKIHEEEGTDLKTAINSFRDLKETLEDKGFIINMDEADLGISYNITINIQKEDN